MIIDKKNVVCDTTIWYRIAEGDISRSQYENYNLIGTFINAYELTRSPVMLKNPIKWSKAVNYFFTLSKEFRTYKPIDYLKKVSGSSYNIHSYIDVMYILRMVYGLSHKDTAEIRREIYDSKRDEKLDVEDWMNQIDEIRLSLYENYGYSEYISQISKPERRNEQLAIAKQFFSRLHNNIDIDWENIPLLRDTFDEWFFQLVKIKNLKLKNNDVSDFMSLSYVKPNEFYWTKDERKTKKYIVSSGNMKYLIE